MPESLKTTDIVLLAAGLSKRMGSTNKMLLPVNGMSMCAHSAMQGLMFLETLPEGGNLIIVTGYRHRELEKTLAPCIDYVSKSGMPINLTVVRNADYRKGQFSSTKTGVALVRENVPFFIALADMPSVTADNYTTLCSLLNGFDAVRPFSDDRPGHPVLHAPSLKEKILNMDDKASVRSLLENCNTLNAPVEGSSWITDVDFPQDFH
jgi:molybdenum cofactor cytidylyltransferase